MKQKILLTETASIIESKLVSKNYPQRKLQGWGHGSSGRAPA
jgi:hypothetical protein